MSTVNHIGAHHHHSHFGTRRNYGSTWCVCTVSNNSARWFVLFHFTFFTKDVCNRSCFVRSIYLHLHSRCWHESDVEVARINICPYPCMVFRNIFPKHHKHFNSQIKAWTHFCVSFLHHTIKSTIGMVASKVWNICVCDCVIPHKYMWPSFPKSLALHPIRTKM